MKKHFVGWLTVVALLIAVFEFSGCSKLFNGSNSNPYYKITQQFKNFCYFDKGSQWTYQDDSTGKTYTLTVGSIGSSIAFQPQNPSTPAFSYDVIEMKMDSNALNITKENVYATRILSDTTYMNGLLRVFSASGADTTFALAFAPQYKLLEPQLLGGQEGIYTNMQIMPYYLVLGKKYDNVYHSRDKFPKIINGNYTTDSVTMDFYIAEHYGIIKWTSQYKGKTSSYSMVSSNLVQ
jgi:hypothetical protein